MKSYEQILKENELLHKLNKQLKQQIFENDISKFPWLGHLGHWFWDYQANKVDFNPMKAEAIGYKTEDIPEHPGFEFFTEKLHPEDYDHVMEQMIKHLKGEVPVWEVKYRIQAKDGTWRLFYDRGKVTQRSSDGKPLLLTGMVFDITDDEKKLSELIKNTDFWKEQAQYDSLTQLLSRYELMNRINQFHDLTKDTNKEFAIWMFDIDHFKQINDQYGHLVGDNVLEQVGNMIRDNLRQSDIAGRYGGDEFIVLFPNTTKRQAAAIAARIQDDIRNMDLQKTLLVTLSGGIVSNQEKDNLRKLIDLADKRLYDAKEQGRNQTVII